MSTSQYSSPLTLLASTAKILANNSLWLALAALKNVHGTLLKGESVATFYPAIERYLRPI